MQAQPNATVIPGESTKQYAVRRNMLRAEAPCWVAASVQSLQLLDLSVDIIPSQGLVRAVQTLKPMRLDTRLMPLT
jgi:hypothetical protein